MCGTYGTDIQRMYITIGTWIGGAGVDRFISRIRTSSASRFTSCGRLGRMDGRVGYISHSNLGNAWVGCMMHIGFFCICLLAWMATS